MQSTNKYIGTTPRQLYIMHKYDDGFYEYTIDLDGYAEIRTIPIWKEENKVLKHMIMDLDDIHMNEIDRTMIKLLHVLAKTNCGHCNTFINPETFSEIEEVMNSWRLINERLSHKTRS